jgi:uncharacterized membrane protein YdjX (TVP38/TMEM64 family)
MNYNKYRYIGYKQVILLLGFLVLISFIWYYYRSGSLDPVIIEKYRIHYPIISICLFILTYAVLVIASIPTLPMNLAAGFFWGSVPGGIYATLGVTIGGWVSFTLAKSIIGKKLTRKFDNKLISNVQQEFDHNGWKFVAFARMTPIIPTGPLNYLLGLTSISNITFLWATLLFLPPVTITVAFIGFTLGSFNVQESGISEIIGIIIVVSSAATFLVAIKFISRLIKK